MGAAESLPQIDKRGQKAIVLAQLTEKDIGGFFSVFKKIDKDLLGKIYVDDFYEYLDEPRSIFSDALFELNETPLARGMLTFGDFLQTVCVFALFEPPQIQQFVYFIFDKDKNGYIRQEDLEVYVKLINQVDFDAEMTSNLGTGWEVLQKEFNKDGKVDFKEFMVFNAEWPAMFYPAYRLQQKMIERTMGRFWWDKKRRALQDIKDKVRAAEEFKKQQERKKLERIRQRKIRKKMGCLRYYFCPCLREHFEKMFPEPVEKKELTYKEKKALLRKAKEDEKKAEQVKERNLQTLEYAKFQQRKQELLEELKKEVKPKRVFRERRVRAEDRRDRWKGKFDM